MKTRTLSLAAFVCCTAVVVLVFLSAGHAIAQTPPRQVIRGQVVDRDTQIPLPGAHVFVLGSDPLIGAATDTTGWFVLQNVPLGRHDLQVTFLGYEPTVLSQVLVTSGKELVLHVELREQVTEGQEIVIVPEVQKGRALNDLALVSARAFSVEETRRYAGGLDDPARMASAFAGITTGGSLEENALIIRGNAPKGVLWRLEGVEIPNPNHFAGLSVAGGGGVTLFSSQLLADSDFLTGAFPAEYGNALAGVFDMNFRAGNRAHREHVVQVGLLGVDVASEGPFRRGKPATYLFNYRYSTIGLLLPLLPTEDVATYQDFSFKLSFPTRNLGRVELWGLGGSDRQTMSANEDSTEWEYETWDRLDGELDQNTGAAGLTHRFILGPNTFLRSSLAVTFQRTDLDQQRIGDDLVRRDHLSILNTDARAAVSSHLNHKFSARHTSRAGVSLQRLFYDLDFTAAPDDYESPVPVARGSGTTSLVQAYVQSKLDPRPGWSLNVGVHLQHFALTGRTSLEPRLGLRRQLTERQALSLGYGLHSQIEDLRVYFVRPPSETGLYYPNRELGFARAHHLVLGYDRRVAGPVRLKLETYYQYLFDVPVIPDSSYSLINFEQDFEFDEALVNDGLGTNYGVELTLERFLHRGFYYLLTGSASRSRYRGGDGIWRDTRFDRRYVVNGLAGKEFTLGGDDLLGVNGRLAWMGGRRRSPVDVAASEARQEVVFDERRAFEEQEPTILLVDVTVTYRRNHIRFSEVWALQVKNLLGTQLVALDYNHATDRVEEVKEGFPLPVLSYKIEF